MFYLTGRGDPSGRPGRRARYRPRQPRRSVTVDKEIKSLPKSSRSNHEWSTAPVAGMQDGTSSHPWSMAPRIRGAPRQAFADRGSLLGYALTRRHFVGCPDVPLRLGRPSLRRLAARLLRTQGFPTGSVHHAHRPSGDERNRKAGQKPDQQPERCIIPCQGRSFRESCRLE